MIRNRQRWFGASSQSSRSGIAARRRCTHWVLEGLEDRLLLSGSPTMYTVDLTSDTGKHTSALAGDILYCVTQANANPNLAGSVIDFSPTVFATPQTITLASTLEPNELSGPEVINGLGANLVTLSGSNSVEVFDIPGTATVMLSNMTIENGCAASGGGIANSGTLTVTNCTLSGNSATGYEGGGAVCSNRAR